MAKFAPLSKQKDDLQKTGELGGVDIEWES